ncbi:glycosyl transferase [Paludibacter sp. 221]|uniref:glycogen/starch synthase n=1 Tax=Paludibacter sp. 221 TaxID=2302939 RepID=UPI0013D6F67E|nr:glycogen/starch synthase [Paludibacter sp. 221]NDV47649.1 glycosyl transferase [Paludibacter sp. 221]
MSKKNIPDYIFEASWEVCNMVGGIYTVLSTRARILQHQHHDKLIFIGPDVWKESPSPYFTESDDLLSGWKEYTNEKYGLDIRVGRWNVPGNPVAVLVDFTPLYHKKNGIYGHVWNLFGVDSLHAYGDYDESSMFGYASGMVVESYYNFFKLSPKQKVVAHFNEWMTTFGIFYLKENLPTVATVFTTHATSIGRSIAGNNKPLYNYLNDYNGDQMAQELNMVAKHSTEKKGAHIADCFTTVSDITARECTQLLERKPDVVTPNGFEDDFIPKGKIFTKKRKEARQSFIRVAEALFGYKLEDDVLLVGTAGRYEYKNKGLDVFMESLKRLSKKEPERQILALIVVPAHSVGPRADLLYALDNPEDKLENWNHFTTHELYDYNNDSIMSAINWYHLKNEEHDRVKVMFMPSYLNGADGIFNKVYYDLLIGMDLTVFPSYYEPWGYTPLESVAFSVPTITTELSGFGQWVSPEPQDIDKGVAVIHRSDYNASHVAFQICNTVLEFAQYDKQTLKQVQKRASDIAEAALWDHFIHHYEEAYDIAIKNMNKRQKNKPQ